MNIIAIREDSKYFEITVEKSDFKNCRNFPTYYNGAKLTFMNLSANMVFYQKEIHNGHRSHQ